MRRNCHLAFFVALLAGTFAWSQTELTLNAWSVDSTPTGSDGKKYVRMELMHESATNQDVQTIGNLYAGVWIGFLNRSLPATPKKLIVKHGGPWNATMDLFIGGQDDGIPIGSFAMARTDSFNIFRTDTFDFDPAVATIPGITGTQDIFILFGGGGAIGEGVGNYASFTLIFDNGVQVVVPRISPMNPNSRMAGYSLTCVTADKPFQLNSMQSGPGAVFSVSGRCVTFSGIQTLVGKGMIITGKR
jgi:hypothetical protein